MASLTPRSLSPSSKIIVAQGDCVRADRTSGSSDGSVPAASGGDTANHSAVSPSGGLRWASTQTDTVRPSR